MDSDRVQEVVLRFYGRLAEEVGCDLRVRTPAEGLTIGALRRQLAEQYGLQHLCSPRVKVAVGDEFVGDDHLVRGGDDVEFLAPLSGG